ncbi:MAG TPA: type II toxin-antitoxin system RelE/ParE family toxin [Phycisphaerae bacterium]|jgi:mRNA interferase RelE/StbE
MYEVRLSARARRFYADAHRPLALKLAHCFRQLEEDPRRHPNIKPLKGKLAGSYRYRVGDHRVIYTIDEGGRIVVVAIIAHRREVYE